MNIEKGEYIRNSEGRIDKVKNPDYYMSQYIECEKYLISRASIVNHSKNEIDLVKKDDFVNGCRVYEVEEKGITVYQKVENSSTDYNYIPVDEIESIVTKEQYKSVEYVF